MSSPFFTCPKCARSSYHPEDIHWGYCAHCHAYTGGGLGEPVVIPLGPSRSEAEAALAVRATLEEGARRELETFAAPDEDWGPVWLVATRTHGFLIFGLAAADKYVMTDLVAGFARRRGAIAIGHLHSSWVISSEDVGLRAREIEAIMRRRGGSTEGIPERVEMLLLQVLTATSGRSATARILRSGSGPPALAAWEDAGGSGVGAMVDPLRESLLRMG